MTPARSGTSSVFRFGESVDTNPASGRRSSRVSFSNASRAVSASSVCVLVHPMSFPPVPTPGRPPRVVPVVPFCKSEYVEEVTWQGSRSDS
jgi:hypothetical protein